MMLRSGKAVAVSAWLIAAAGAAWAQRIDQFLAPELPGSATDPGVSVLSRVRPEYEMRGFHLGDFVVKPEFDQSLGYASNVTGTAPARGSPLLESAAAMTAASDWGRDTIGGGLSMDRVAYPAQPRQSFFNWAANIGGSYDIGRDTLALTMSHRGLTQTPGDLDVPNLDRPIAYRIDAAALSYTARASHVSLTPGVAISTYGYDNGTVGGVPYAQSFRDHAVLSPSIEARYEVDPLRGALLVLRDGAASYQHQTPGAVNFNDVTVLGGVSFDTGLLRARLLGGYETRHYSSASQRPISAPIVEAAVIYTPSGLTTFTLDAARAIEDSMAQAAPGYVETALTLLVEHEYFKNVLLSAHAGVFHNEFQAGGGSQTLYAVGVGGTWLLNRHARLALTYDFTARQGALASSMTVGAAYSASRVVLQARIGY